MTATSNIFPNLTAWAASTAKAVGQRVSNGTNAYQCIAAGTTASSGGPTGTGLSITDGTVVWEWIAYIDYTSINSWVAAVASSTGATSCQGTTINVGTSGTLNQPVVCALWQSGVGAYNTPVAITGGQTWATVSGITTSATNTITITVAGGESFADTIAANPSTTPLAYNTNNGFTITANGTYIDVIDCNCSWISVSRIQLYYNCPNQSNGIRALASNFSFSDCLVNTVTNGGRGTLIRNNSSGGYFLVTNCLFIDQTSSGTSSNGNIKSISTATETIINCTFVSVNGASGGAIDYYNTGITIKNCLFLNYTGTPITTTGGGYGSAGTISYSAIPQASISVTNLTPSNMQYNQTGAANLVAPYTNMQLISSSPCATNGVVDTTDIPSATDIIGQSRGSSGWSIGAWQYVSSIPSNHTNFFFGGD